MAFYREAADWPLDIIYLGEKVCSKRRELGTREGRPFLRINGIQIQGEEITDLGPELPQLRELGVDVLCLYPQAEGMAGVVAHFDLARRSPVAPPRIAACNGYWHGEPGMRVPGTA